MLTRAHSVKELLNVFKIEVQAMHIYLCKDSFAHSHLYDCIYVIALLFILSNVNVTHYYPTCDPPQQANSLCHVQGQPTAADVALLYMAL